MKIMNLGFPKSTLLHKLSIYTYFKIKLDRISAISHCTTPFYMPPFSWFLNESQKKPESMKSGKEIGTWWGWLFKTADIEFR